MCIKTEDSTEDRCSFWEGDGSKFTCSFFQIMIADRFISRFMFDLRARIFTSDDT